MRYSGTDSPILSSYFTNIKYTLRFVPYKNVLILVVVEDVLVPISVGRNGDIRHVLILVVVEDVLVLLQQY